ncbi:MAG TPA: NYN domain-containing protein [Thermoanaerobaculia bacterium]|nr:NYN domain-containing protein [Thermoanaerobaculia bacterium]
MEEEPAAAAEAATSEAEEPRGRESLRHDTTPREEEIPALEETAHDAREEPAADGAPEPAPRASEPSIVRLDDEVGGAAEDAGATDEAELAAGSSEAATTSEETSEEPAPKPRRRRSSRRRGGGAGAQVSANGAAAATNGSEEAEPPRRPSAAPAAAPQRRDAGGSREGAEARRPHVFPAGGGTRGGRGEGAPDLLARAPAPRPSPPWSAPPQQPTGAESAALVTAREVAHQIADALREALAAAPDSADDTDTERKIALFCDLENIAIGVRDSETKKFDIDLVLERLLEKGKIIVKKAYADWQRYTEFKKPLHTAGIELIDIPQKYYSGKNSADIKMVVDAMDLCYSKEHLDTFVLLSGDSDFTPLVSKLKENNKHVIGVGVKSSSSKLLIDNCDEFLYYEDIWRDSLQAPVLEGIDEKKAEAFALMNDSIQALIRENKPVLWGSMIKQTMQRKRPSFNEGYYGYGSFSELLEDAERKKVIHLKKDARSGSWVVSGFAKAR